MMDCSMDEKGVTPIPVATRTACSERKMSVAGAPKGPSRWICRGEKHVCYKSKTVYRVLYSTSKLRRSFLPPGIPKASISYSRP